jgi:hypothetical protein
VANAGKHLELTKPRKGVVRDAHAPEDASATTSGRGRRIRRWNGLWGLRGLWGQSSGGDRRRR